MSRTLDGADGPLDTADIAPTESLAVPDRQQSPLPGVVGDPVRVPVPDLLRRLERYQGLLAASGSGSRMRRDTTEALIHRSPSRTSPPASTPGTPRQFHIYNDSLPASSQPQTPQNLPEARHQSRLRGSYTVPARRISLLPIRTPMTGRVRRGAGRRRNPSPPGLVEPGFRGLYGGIENTDDSVLFEQAMRDLELGGPSAEPSA
jgi:hypothetical protein